MKIPEALTEYVKRDSRYSNFIQEYHEENQKAARKYLLGRDLIAEVTDGEYTVAFVSVEGYTVNVVIHNNMLGYPVAGGRFMNQWEPDHYKYYRVTEGDWNRLSYKEKAEVEAALQLKKWVRREFYRKFAELYYPKDFDSWWWNEGGSKLAMNTSIIKENQYWKNRLQSRLNKLGYH